MTALIRPAVRVLLLDEHDHVLLFRLRLEHGAGIWIAPGGGVEGDEDVQVTAQRELAEETGLTAVDLGPEIWRRRSRFRYRGVDYDQRERWFMARVERFIPARTHLTAEEHVDLLEHRWWSVAALAASDAAFAPRDLAAQLERLLINGPADPPADVGE